MHLWKSWKSISLFVIKLDTSNSLMFTNILSIWHYKQCLRLITILSRFMSQMDDLIGGQFRLEKIRQTNDLVLSIFKMRWLCRWFNVNWHVEWSKQMFLQGIQGSFAGEIVVGCGWRKVLWRHVPGIWRVRRAFICAIPCVKGTDD